MSDKPIVLASRASKLAEIQTYMVRDALQAKHPELAFTVSLMATEGDKNQSQALYVLGGKSLWTKELEVVLLQNEVDILVHCLKDVPTTLPEGCELGAVLEREDPADSLVVKQGQPYKTLGDLPPGSVIGTSSVRRVAQLKRNYPNLIFKDVRGNLNTRLAKLDAPDGEYLALILAKAGLVRLGWRNRISSDILPPDLYYAVGQAALTVEIRSNDPKIAKIVSSLNHRSTDLCCRAERACLSVLEGGCSVPVGVTSSLDPDDNLSLTATITSLSGDRHIQHTLVKKIHNLSQAEVLGTEVAHLLISSGGDEILKDVASDRASRQDLGTKVLSTQTRG